MHKNVPKNHVIFTKCHICVLTAWTGILINHEKGIVMAHHICLCTEADPTPLFPSPPTFRILVKCPQRWKKATRDPMVLTSLQSVEGGLQWWVNGLRGVQAQQAGAQAAGGENVSFGVDMGRPWVPCGVSYREQQYQLSQNSGILKDYYRMTLLVGAIP